MVEKLAGVPSAIVVPEQREVISCICSGNHWEELRPLLKDGYPLNKVLMAVRHEVQFKHSRNEKETGGLTEPTLGGLETLATRESLAKMGLLRLFIVSPLKTPPEFMLTAFPEVVERALERTRIDAIQAIPLEERVLTPMVTKPAGFISQGELLELLRISPAYWYKIKGGFHIESVKVGRLVYYRSGDVEIIKRQRMAAKEHPVKVSPTLFLQETEALIEKAVGGDAESFGVLYEQYVDRIHRHMYYRTGSQEIAEDLTSQVFFNAWKAMSNFRDMDRPFAVWLFAIAHNLLVDHYRAKRETLSVDKVIIPADDRTDPVALAETHLENAALWQAILRLKRDWQAVVVMRYIEQMDYSEIAVILNKSEATVRVRLHRALTELRKLMPKEELV